MLRLHQMGAQTKRLTAIFWENWNTKTVGYPEIERRKDIWLLKHGLDCEKPEYLYLACEVYSCLKYSFCMIQGMVLDKITETRCI